MLLQALSAALLSLAPPRTLYPTRAPRSSGTLPLGGPHTLYYEEHGLSGGSPALFLHGGPGAGCFARHAGFFDPSTYRVVLYDQRGCGRSSPKGELEDNDTPHLIADIEALREHLGIERWEVVLGGSWGTTLALAYAASHPERVGAMVLRALCLMSSAEIRWLFGEHGGVCRLLPDAWSALRAHWEGARTKLPGSAEAEAAAASPSDRLLHWYAFALGGAGGDDAAMSAAAGAWRSRLPSLMRPR